MRRLSTISIRNPMAAGLITVLKEDPDEETMSLFHSWGETGEPHDNLQIELNCVFEGSSLTTDDKK